MVPQTSLLEWRGRQTARIIFEQVKWTDDDVRITCFFYMSIAGKLRYLHIKKLATAPKCGDCGTKLPGVRLLAGF